MNTYLVTGAAGFIGSAFVHILAADESARIVVLDKLTYAGNLQSLEDLIADGRIEFVKGDIADRALVSELFSRHDPDYVVNFAAESHVDRSVDDPTPFITTNVGGVFTLLECARQHIKAKQRDNACAALKMFVQVSTDEVYGDLEAEEPRLASQEVCSRVGRDVIMYGPEAFCESSPLHGSSPYSASKASGDLLALSYYRSFGLPVAVTRCSNNYGPRQFPEKLIPLMINNIVEGRSLPVYGRGLNVRDWIHVDDHSRGILAVLRKGKPGEVYNFGAYCEKRNIDIVKALIAEVARQTGTSSREDLLTYVQDRPGHDRRYAIESGKAHAELGWCPQIDFESGLAQTVRWNLENRSWIENIIGGEYRSYYQKMYGNRQ